MSRFLLFLLLMLVFLESYAQSHSHQGMRALHYPNIEGYVTLKTDLHQHSVFSDGEVWPSIRVMEALRENLDVISLTEHLEYQPHKADIPHPDRNRSYELALDEAKEHGLLIINGSEITRSEPIGHSNAVFIQDANKLLNDKAEATFREANEQGAFVFWNHPAWYDQSPSGNPILSDFQKERIEKGELHGIEVINTFDYAEESLALALKHNLTIMGTSDIHGLIDWDYLEKGNHRPITLVFAKEKTLESTREALFAGRTVAVYNSLMVGREVYLKPLLKACVEIKSAHYIEDTQIARVVLENNSSSDLTFENQMPYNFYSTPPVFTLRAGESKTLNIKTLEELDKLTLSLKALGAYTAPRTQPVIDWEITLR
ncbi:Sb-PDE family phosphodiesterase [Lentiprolixibacter aurantiacus]|uniref:Sb-PDE family phosphodiesterase n=1 Tax=Lentiprolixibacter aurantiacus TaxID=2993939 RepID=A0AAE3MND6_9FLAO|nr:Sb-PDE family phosphodiesterase [Lentiprolixibacter aurantiacus]MCX2720604.1 Sb-PDE family phosphodiesterase [Lentiprolixibacter aurantiacus]